jgi:hypothetical protein
MEKRLFLACPFQMPAHSSRKKGGCQSLLRRDFSAPAAMRPKARKRPLESGKTNATIRVPKRFQLVGAAKR